MTFPSTPAPVSVQIALDANPADDDTWVWTDISGYLRESEGITINYGRRDEASVVDAAKCQVRVDNRDGRFCRFNPDSPYYGQLGLNTPLRVQWNVAADAFDRTTANSWGTADSGQSWSQIGGALADFFTSDGHGVHSHPEVNTSHLTLLAGTATDVAVSVGLEDTPTGDPINGGVVVRRTGGSYLVASLAFPPTGDVQLDVYRMAAVGFLKTSLDSAATGMFYTAGIGSMIRVRLEVTGQRVRAKAWFATDDEPAGWACDATDTTLDMDEPPMTYGCWSWVQSDNTNDTPIRVVFDDLAGGVDRFTGFISELPPAWDMSGNDATASITANGPLRRLQQGEAPLRSTVNRYLLARAATVPGLIEYWPLEDDTDSASMASAVPGGTPMHIHGEPRLASDSRFAGSKPLPAQGTASKFSGVVRPYTDTGEFAFRLLMSVPDDGYDDDQQLFAIRTVGATSTSNNHFIIDYDADTEGGRLILRILDVFGNTYLTQAIRDGVNGELAVFTVKATNSGSNFGWSFENLVVLDDSTTQFAATSGTITGRNIGTALYINVTLGGAPGFVAGHVALANDNDFFLSFSPAGNRSIWYGARGEAAAARISRLARENALPFLMVGDDDTSTRMGPQRPANLLSLIRDAEAVDGGVLHELGSGLAFTPRRARYNQTPRLALDADSGHIAEPPEPTDDDQMVVNEFTAKRVDGSSSTVSNQDHIDAHGRYEDSATLNVWQDNLLKDIAAWRVHRGTVEALRWPSITLDLSRNPSLIPGWLGFQIGNRITVDHSITQLPGIDVDLLVEGWTERISTFRWTAELNAVPAGPWNPGVLDDTPERRAAPVATTLAVDITSSTTSFQVETTGTLWTTDADSLPLDIVVGGERMTVTAIGEVFGLQSFTVTRSINGIVKAHAAGTTVQLAADYQLYAAL